MVKRSETSWLIKHLKSNILITYVDIVIVGKEIGVVIVGKELGADIENVKWHYVTRSQNNATFDVKKLWQN